ncbi:tyrosine-type recombinase/integrase [Singulisphaera rosea]
MRSPELSRLVTDFFRAHLGAERNVSHHTTLAYRDALKLFLRFAADRHQRPVDRLTIGDFTPEVVLAFLDSLETARHNTIRTRNARLAAIHCFFRYVLDCELSHAALCQRILAIPVKKAVRPSLGYLSDEELGNLLGQVDRSTREGRRDYLLLALLYDTGTRIQELLDMTPADFQLTSPAFVRVLGKGKKERLCPLLPQTARVVSRFIEAEGHQANDRGPLFQNRRGEKLTRQGARYLLKKYLNGAAKIIPRLNRSGISLHTLRHTKAMHLLQSGVPIITIKDVLGHADVKSTEVYVQTDLEAKRKALEQGGAASKDVRRSRELAPDLLAWLESL